MDQAGQVISAVGSAAGQLSIRVLIHSGRGPLLLNLTHNTTYTRVARVTRIIYVDETFIRAYYIYDFADGFMMFKETYIRPTIT